MRHIRREILPWRTKENYTECNIKCENAQVISHQEYRQEYGDGAKGGDICKTCSKRDEKLALWEEDALRAHMDVAYSYYRYSSLQRVELRAFAAVIKNHRGEYLDLLRAFTVEAVAMKHNDTTARELRACYGEFTGEEVL